MSGSERKAQYGKRSIKHSRTTPAHNVRLARNIWPLLSEKALRHLRALSEELRLSLAAGDITYLDNGWYITHSGLLRLARRNRCAGIHVRPLNKFCDPSASRWAFEATVYKSRNCRGFVGCGDADPSNVSARVRGAEMRVAETRAVNRALRKAYGIGICSVEELGSYSGPFPPAAPHRIPLAKTATANGNGHHPLRDQLCLLIRQHQLDFALVKAYAAEYCDVAELRQASREQIAAFIKHLAEEAQVDREGLFCKLNSYAPKPVIAAPMQTSTDVPQAEQEKGAGAA